MTTSMRLEAELTDSASIHQVQRLRAYLNSGNADLIRNALMLLDWAVTQVAEGRQLASVGPANSAVREFSMPVLERARMSSRLSLSPDAFERMIETLEHPSAPTEALRSLLATRRQGVGAPKDSKST
ncbi:MAG: DUF1778 domain-containing protein [Gemmatimonadales bacterium]|nr:DUF1778 domain-containing protein [Gemmatimonadales bacterium]MDZ4390435.1 DUF1778 domain-containing protein [Gemmatimonadales bacterium]